MSDSTLPRQQGAERYGKLYWCIKSDTSSDGEIYVMADRIEVTSAGAMIAWGGGSREGYPVLALAAGKWTAAYAASVLDGSAVAVEHWAGEVQR